VSPGAKRHRRWWILAIFLVVVAAAAVGGILWFGRSKTPAVRYLTATAATGTIADTIQADFTLAAAHGTTTIALGGSAASSGAATGNSSTSTGATSSTTTSSRTNTNTAVATFVARATSDSGSPVPTPSASTTDMPTPSPSATTTPKPTPKPRPSRTRTPSPKPTSSGGFGGGPSSGTRSSTSSSTSSGSSTTTTSVSGVVTRISLPVGATPHTLQRLLTVSGKPIFAFVSSTPLYKTLSVSLSSGSQVANVMALQRALKAGGYYTGSVNGTFGTSTQTAVEAWQADQGVSQTGLITTTQFVWVPKGRIIYSWSVALGNQVSSGTALATVGAPRDLVAQALVSQADIASLKVGQKATLTIDGDTSDPFTGTISFIDSQPASSGSSVGSSSSTVEYTVDFLPHRLPSLARSGMTGTLAIILAQRTNVLIVPTRAVSGTSSVPYVRVMVNGTPAYRQVQTGMATSTYTQITDGLAAGEVVVTGQYSNAATSTSGSSGFGGLSGFPGGGTFRRSSGSSGGSGSFPVPPGQ